MMIMMLIKSLNEKVIKTIKMLLQRKSLATAAPSGGKYLTFTLFKVRK